MDGRPELARQPIHGGYLPRNRNDVAAGMAGKSPTSVLPSVVDAASPYQWHGSKHVEVMRCPADSSQPSSLKRSQTKTLRLCQCDGKTHQCKSVVGPGAEPETRT